MLAGDGRTGWFDTDLGVMDLTSGLDTKVHAVTLNLPKSTTSPLVDFPGTQCMTTAPPLDQILVRN